MNYESELKNIRYLGQTKLERTICFFGIISGWVAALSAGFLVGLVFIFIYFMFPGEKSLKAPLYFISASILSHLIGCFLCLIFRLKKFQPLMISIMGVAGVIIFSPYFRCLAFSQCISIDALIERINFSHMYPFYTFIFFVSFATAAIVTSVEPMFWRIKSYHNASFLKLNI